MVNLLMATKTYAGAEVLRVPADTKIVREGLLLLAVVRDVAGQIQPLRRCDSIKHKVRPSDRKIAMTIQSDGKHWSAHVQQLTRA